MDIADRRIATVHFTLTDEQGQVVATANGTFKYWLAPVTWKSIE